jgi:hypothetical protein
VIDYLAVLDDLAEKRAAAVNLFDQVSAGLRLLVRSPAPTPVAPPRQLRAPAKAKKPQRAAAKVQRAPARSAAKAKPAPAKIASSPATKTPGRAAPADVLSRAKAIAAREGLRAAATATGINYQTLYGRWKREGWKVAPSPKGVRLTTLPKAAPKPTTKPEKTPLRVCASCQLRTQTDPCDRCGTKWNRAQE